MKPRSRHEAHIVRLFDSHPIVGLVGARQVGKTTLARAIAARERITAYFDLEDPRDAARLDDPVLALEPLTGLIVIDEVQRHPDLFPVLRVLVDRVDVDARFLVTGSASPDLLRQSSETLAGRIAYHVLDGFALDETGDSDWRTLWSRGGFPRACLAIDDRASADWRRAFITTFIERDLPALGVRIPSTTTRRFWTMLAHLHGQTCNFSELGRSLGHSDQTVRRYLDALTDCFMVRQLRPWHENLAKRQVKSPKVYIRDSGLMHTLLDIADLESLQCHPKLGASWEGFALSETLCHVGAHDEQCHFWATHQGAEIDLVVMSGRSRRGFEFKHTSAPRRTRSMTTAMADLRLDRLDVIFPGAQTWPIGERMYAVGIEIMRQVVPVRV